MPTRDAYLAGTRFESHVDPDDPNFRLIAIRVPNPPGNTYRDATLTSIDAMRKDIRRAAALLVGCHAIPHYLGREIFDAYSDGDGDGEGT